MPVRLDDEGQKSVDQSWDKALDPIDRLAHQPLLDVLLSTQAYQIGVDRLTFRSEKKVAAGKVVMEIDYDRLKPDQDRFELKVYDPAGKLLRQERYRRAEVEETYQDLFVRYQELRRKVDGGQATPDEIKLHAKLKGRRDAIDALFPKDKDKKP
jgi:hypothetical protein